MQIVPTVHSRGSPALGAGRSDRVEPQDGAAEEADQRRDPVAAPAQHRGNPPLLRAPRRGAIRRYQDRTLSTAEIIAELVELARHLRGPQGRGAALGLRDDELAGGGVRRLVVSKACAISRDIYPAPAPAA